MHPTGQRTPLSTHRQQTLTSVQLDAQLFTVFTLRDGRIVHLRDSARRSLASGRFLRSD